MKAEDNNLNSENKSRFSVPQEELDKQKKYTELVQTVLSSRYEDKPKAFVHTYGCQGNVADGERIKGILCSLGYELTEVLEDADFVLAAYGTCARVCKKAVKVLREQGIKAGLFRPITLWPFPQKELEKACENAKKILTVEMSMGQMVQDIKLYSGHKVSDVDFYGEPGGIIPSVDVIVEKVKSYV